MTKEIYEQLKKYDGKLYTALYAQFVRLTDPKDKEELDRIYKEHTGEDGHILRGCGRCILNAMRFMAKDYFKMKLEEEKGTTEEVQKEPEQKPQPIENKVVAKPKPKTAVKKAASPSKKTSK